MRVDSWLWFTRLVKTRGLAQRLIADGRVRINRQRLAKPSHPVRPGDVVTVAVHGQVRVLRVVAEGVRRGPAAEARTLYEELSAPAPVAPGDDGPL